MIRWQETVLYDPWVSKEKTGFDRAGLNESTGHETHAQPAIVFVGFGCLRTFAPYVGAWLSPVEHLVRDEGVGGSNPLAPTLFNSLMIRLLSYVHRFLIRELKHAESC